MLRIMGGNPVVGVLLCAVLLAVGLTTNRPVLAVAGAFVGLASVVRLMSGSSRERDEEPKTRRGPGLRL